MLTKTERLVRLILLLQSRRRTCGELADLLEVSRRTVMRDVEALNLMGVPVASRSGPGGFYEMDQEKTLRPLELTGSEAFLLALSLDALLKLNDVPFEQSRETLTAKVKALLPAAQFEKAVGRVDAVHFDIPERKNRTPELQNLIERCGQWALLEYESDSGQISYTARIERVYADRGLWYVQALVRGRRRNLRADRVLSIVPCEQPEDYLEPRPYDDPSHPLVRVLLTYRGLRTLERDPHLGHLAHGKRSPVVIEFRCPPEELDWYSRYFGGMVDDAKVLESLKLKKLIVWRAEKMLEKYGE
jgi:predicted DNA-binding transcriptional regulator YafY